VPVGPEYDTQHLMQFDKDADGKVHKKRLFEVMVIWIKVNFIIFLKLT
jgi:Ca2+-binding EF-hand superfamily protein